MKKLLLITLVLVCSSILLSCDNRNENLGPRTTIVFDNSGGVDALVYDDPNRDAQIAAVCANGKSGEIERSPGEATFFFAYSLQLKNDSNFSLPLYRPDNLDINQDRVYLYPDTINTTQIPPLAKIVDPDTVLFPNGRYLFIQNDSLFSIELMRGSSTSGESIRPDGSPTSLVHAGSSGQYTIDSGGGTGYYLLRGSTPYPLPSLEAGYVYYFTFNGSIVLETSRIKLTLANMQDNTVQWQPPTGGGPAVPAGVAAARNPAGSTTVRITWDAVSGATSYRVYYSSTGGNSGMLEGSPTTVSFNSTGNSATETYFFRVAAVNSAGQEGSPSSWVEVGPAVAPPAPVTPAVPTGVTAVRNSALRTMITVSWNAVSGAVYYRVYYSTTGSGAGMLLPLSPSTTSLDTFDNDTGSFHYFRVAAVNSAGEGPSSPWVSVGPVLSVGGPPAPSGVTATRDPNGLTTVRISWNAVSGATSYNVFYSTTTSGSGNLVAGGTTATWIDIPGFSTSITHYFRVSAVNSAGQEGSPSSWVGVGPTSVFSAPTGVTAERSSTTPTTVTITWNAASGATSYRVYYSSTGTGSGTQIGAPTSRWFTSTDHSTTATHYFRVSAVNNNGEEASSSWVSVGIVSVPSSAPTGVTITRPSLSSATVNIRWNAVSGATGYRVYYSSTASGTGTLVGSVSTTSYTGTIDNIYGNHYYSVAAANAAGVGPQSPWVYVP